MYTSVRCNQNIKEDVGEDSKRYIFTRHSAEAVARLPERQLWDCLPGVLQRVEHLHRPGHVEPGLAADDDHLGADLGAGSIVPLKLETQPN